MTTERVSWQQRWTDFRPTKTALFWSCVGCIAATLVLGFTWGGWVTGGTAQEMAADAAGEARTQLAASVCVDRFLAAPEAGAQLASLKKSDFWERDDFIEKGGWVKIAGQKETVDGAAELCAERLLEAKMPATQAAAKSG